MIRKQYIAFGVLLLVILILSIYIVVRKPETIIEKGDTKIQKDSIQLLLKTVKERNKEVADRDSIIEALNKADLLKEKQYVKEIQYINNPNTPMRSLDSIVRSIAGIRK